MAFKTIDYARLITDYIPYSLRQNRSLQYLFSLIKPIRVDNAQFLQDLKSLTLEAKMNSQLIMVEYYLNNKSLASDPVYIVDGQYNSNPYHVYGTEGNGFEYFYKDETNRALIGGDKSIIYNNDVDLNEDHDFKVIISENDYINDETRNNIKSIVDKYKVVGSKYLIYKY
jgi:hypothetical protein